MVHRVDTVRKLNLEMDDQIACRAVASSRPAKTRPNDGLFGRCHHASSVDGNRGPVEMVDRSAKAKQSFSKRDIHSREQVTLTLTRECQRTGYLK